MLIVFNVILGLTEDPLRGFESMGRPLDQAKGMIFQGDEHIGDLVKSFTLR